MGSERVCGQDAISAGLLSALRFGGSSRGREGPVRENSVRQSDGK